MHSSQEVDEFTSAVEAYAEAVHKLVMVPLKCYCKGLRALAQVCSGSEIRPLVPQRAVIDRGMTVMTRGGIFGTVVDLDEQAVTIRIAENTHVRAHPSHLAAVRRPRPEERGSPSRE